MDAPDLHPVPGRQGGATAPRQPIAAWERASGAGPREPGWRLRIHRREASCEGVRDHLEAGGLLLFPDLDFPPVFAALFQESGDGSAKNISFDTRTGAVKGAAAEAPEALLRAVLATYADWAAALVRRIAPAYGASLQLGKGSFRPRPAEQAMSARKDDRRLHVDAFPSQPAQGRRILRVFRNIDPRGAPRVWQVGEPFAEYAGRFLPQVRRMAPGEAWLLRALGLTKARRTAYDQLMLGLHDAAKASDDYQVHAPRETLAFPAGATWMAFTDITPHAALSGRFALEQTFFLPLAAMADPALSPLRILESMTGRRLV